MKQGLLRPAAAVAISLASWLTSGPAGAQTATPTITGYTAYSNGAAITSATPNTLIKIVGTNLGSSGTVKIAGLSARLYGWASTGVVVYVPTAATYPTTGPAVLTLTGGKTATGPNFTITAPGGTTAPAPTISGYTNTSGGAITAATAGTSIKVVGANLGTSGTVTFNGISATPSAWSTTAVTVTVPSAATYPNTGPVRVTTGGQTATGANFTINAPPTTVAVPTISGYTNTSGGALTAAVPGTSVKIVGTNFGTTGTVTFNGISAAPTSWTSTAITVSVPTAATYPNTGPVRVTSNGQTGTGANFTINAPPVTAAVPTISSYTNLSGTALSATTAGASIKIVGANFGATGSVTFNGISATPSAWTATAITVPVPTATTYPNTGPIRVTTGGQTATGANFTINAPATTSGRNVRNYGATGNGSTDDSAAVQRAFDAAQPGEAVYFPSGTYRLGATVNVQKSNLRIYGDGDASTISGDTTQRNLFYVKLAGAQLTGLKFEHLRLVGARVFDKNLNGGVAFYLESAPGAQVTDCTFEGCGMATSDDGSTSGTTLLGCRIRDWGRNGVFINNGANISNTSFDQHDPNAADKVTSHAIYVHGSDDLIQGCSFSGVRYYAIQLYGVNGGAISNVRIVGNQFNRNLHDIVVLSGGVTISEISITDNSFSAPSSYSLLLQSGTGLHVLRNQFSDITDGAVVLGNGGSLSNVNVDDNTYSLSFAALPGDPIFNAIGDGGSLSNVAFRRNRIQTFVSHTGIYLSHVAGAVVDSNTITMPASAGTSSLCAGIRAINGSTGVQILGNTVNGSGAVNAYGVYAVGLGGTGSAVTNNILNRCKLDAGGAATSGNTLNP